MIRGHACRVTGAFSCAAFLLTERGGCNPTHIFILCHIDSYSICMRLHRVKLEKFQRCSVLLSRRIRDARISVLLGSWPACRPGTIVEASRLDWSHMEALSGQARGQMAPAQMAAQNDFTLERWGMGSALEGSALARWSGDSSLTDVELMIFPKLASEVEAREQRGQPRPSRLRGIVALLEGWCAYPEWAQVLYTPPTGELILPAEGPIRCNGGEILEWSLQRLAKVTAEDSGVHSQFYWEVTRVSKAHGAELALDFACELLRKLDDDSVFSTAALLPAEEYTLVLDELLGFSPLFLASAAAPRFRRSRGRAARRSFRC
jgi:hypothetical protein